MATIRQWTAFFNEYIVRGSSEDEPMNEYHSAEKHAPEASTSISSAERGLIGFLERIFGVPLGEAAMLVTDRVRFWRFKQKLKLQEKTEEILHARGVEETRTVPAKVAVPLLEAASLEDDESIHTLWSRLLANAMDPGWKDEITSTHVSVLGQLQPIDALILQRIYQDLARSGGSLPQTLFARSRLAAALGVDENRIELSLLNLVRLGCVTPGVVSAALKVGGDALSSYKGTEMVHLSLLGYHLMFAIAPRDGDSRSVSHPAT